MIKCRLYSSVNPWGLKPSLVALTVLTSNCFSILQNGSKRLKLLIQWGATFFMYISVREFGRKNALTFKDGNDGNVMFVGSIKWALKWLSYTWHCFSNGFCSFFFCRQFVVKQGSDLFMEHLTGWHPRSLMARGMEERRISGKFSFGHTFYTSRTIL